MTALPFRHASCLSAVDEHALRSACEQMLAIESPLSTAKTNELAYLEGQLAARPGTAAAVAAAATE